MSSNENARKKQLTEAERKLAEQRKEMKKKSEYEKGIELTERIARLEEDIETIQTKDLHLTVKRIGNIVMIRAQTQDKLMACLHDMINEYEIVSLSVNGSCHALLKKTEVIEI